MRQVGEAIARQREKVLLEIRRCGHFYGLEPCAYCALLVADLEALVREDTPTPNKE